MAGNGNDHHQVFHHDSAPQSGMSLNVHLTVPPSEAAAAAASSGGHTPNTPEILNSIVNMQAAGGPFAAGYASATAAATAVAASAASGAAAGGNAPPTSSRRGSAMNPADEELASERMLHQRAPPEAASPTSSVASVASSLSSPVGSSEMGTPSSSMGVQDYRRLFIKEGLKMKVQQKIGTKKEIPQVVVHPPSPMDQKPPFIPENLQHPPEDGATSPPLLHDGMPKIKEELTEEDESRRQRRRERNKVAATKCRNKKKAKTINLMKESETLEAQNRTLKSEIDRLEGEKKRLMDMLSAHDPTCAKRFKEMTTEAPLDQAIGARARISPESSNQHFRVPAAPMMTSSTSSKRPPSPPSLDSVQNSYGFGYSGQDVKTEGASSSHLVMEVDHHHGGDGANLEQGYLLSSRNVNSCGFTDPSTSSAQGHFLGKRSLSQTYLDLDSRCIAL